MKKKVPIRFIEDHSADEIIDSLWKKEISSGWLCKQQEIPPILNDKEEKVVSVTADIKTYAIAILSILLIAILSGYYMNDGRISAEYKNIQEQNKNINVQTRILNNASGSIAKSIQSREKSYNKIKFILNEK